MGGAGASNDDQRLMMVALLLENLGVERVVQLGSPDVWRTAVAKLEAGAR